MDAEGDWPRSYLQRSISFYGYFVVAGGSPSTPTLPFGKVRMAHHPQRSRISANSLRMPDRASAGCSARVVWLARGRHGHAPNRGTKTSDNRKQRSHTVGATGHSDGRSKEHSATLLHPACHSQVTELSNFIQTVSRSIVQNAQALEGPHVLVHTLHIPPHLIRATLQSPCGILHRSTLLLSFGCSPPPRIRQRRQR
jgi:hypothetical protein